MKKNRPTKSQLDLIAVALLKSDEMTRGESDHIAGRPDLFNAVLNRIENEKCGNTLSAKSAPGIFSLFLRPVPVFAVASILLSAFISLYFYGGRTVPAARVSIRPAETRPQNASKSPDIVTSVEEFKKQPAVVAADTPTVPSVPAAVQAGVVRKKTSPKPRVVRQEPDKDDMGEFYALAYSGDPDHDMDGAQIIRVELPRSALYAMGVNVPVENEAIRIKTDLLVGPDGVMRAVRFVK